MEIFTILDLEREKELTEGLSEQAVFSLHAKRRAVFLADYLLDEGGRLHRLNETISLLQSQGYILGPQSYNDGDITDHFIRTVKLFHSSPYLVGRLQSFTLSLCDPKLEEMIAITLEIEPPLSDRHVIWAVLSALLCPLRQSVGSCFATAPAIIVHEEQVGLFLDDLQQLLTKGQLLRVIAGVESVVPISPSPGIGELKKRYNENNRLFEKVLESLGLKVLNQSQASYLEVLEELILSHFELKKEDLLKNRERNLPKLERIEAAQRALQRAKWQMVAITEHLLLKIWEFTVASFVDVKTEFSRWNLFSSLGLQMEEKGGIGELIYTHLQQMLVEANKKLEYFQQEYEIAFDHVRATEQLLRGVSSLSDARRLKAEHQGRLHHMYACLEKRDKWNEQAQNIANFFPFLINEITAKFQEFFQEAYDAEMQEIGETLYDDSPAGFRLLYKHRRSYVGSWTFIYTKEQYIEALRDFFLAIENPVIESCPWEEGKVAISHLITAIIYAISSEEFLISAFYRMAKAHRMPFQKITPHDFDKIEKKPWAYTSGGTIPTLIKTYFRREGSLSKEARWVESPQDLLIFLIETLKLLPPKITDQFVRNPHKRMLMTGPTHAFSLLPGQEFFCQGWEDRGFTYTWVRDQVLLPGKDFYGSIQLDITDQLYLIDELAQRFNPLRGHELRRDFESSSDPITVQSFREKLPSASMIDAFLFEMLPLITPLEMEGLSKELSLKIKPLSHSLGRRLFHDRLIAGFPIYQSHDLHAEIAKQMQLRKLCPPKPLLFADTNWTKFYFSFLVSPSSGRLELWRTDKIGLTGTPMKEWEFFLNGTLKEMWEIFLNPNEYSS